MGVCQNNLVSFQKRFLTPAETTSGAHSVPHGGSIRFIVQGVWSVHQYKCMRCFVEYLGHLLMHYLENGKLQLKTAYQHEEWDLPSKLSAAWSGPPSNYRDMLEDKDFDGHENHTTIFSISNNTCFVQD